MKRISFALLIAVIMLCCAIYTSADETTGECGESVFWKIENSTLTISGSGETENYHKKGSLIADTPWKDYNNTIVNVVVKSGVTAVSEYLFSNMPALKSVTLASTVESIGKYAFSNCTELIKIKMNEGLVSIGDFCFFGDVKLKNLQIPASVESIGAAFVLGTTDLTDVSIAAENRNYLVKGNAVYTYGCDKIHSCLLREDEPYIIPDTVTELMPYCFSGLTIDRLFVPGSVKIIGDNAFADSTINTVITENSVENYTRTGYGNHIFLGASRVYSVPFGYCADNIMWMIEDGCLNIFGNGNMPKFKNENGITSAQWGDYRADVYGVNISSGIEYVSDYCFFGMSNIVSAALNNGVKKLGAYAFAKTGISSISIPESVSDMSSLAFYKCTKLKTIGISKSNRYYKNTGGIVYNSKGDTVEIYPCGNKSTDLSIPYGVKTVNKYAFAGCTVNSIYIPLTVTSIGKGAFKNSSIKTVNFEHTKSQVKSLLCDNDIYALRGAVLNYNKHNDTEKISAVKATFSANGLTQGEKCKNCGKITVKQKTVYKIKKVSISDNSFIYNKKSHKPSVTVFNAKNKKLKNKTDYTVKYSSSSDAEIGQYTVTVTFNGNYSGVKKLSYTVKPAKATGLKLTSTAEKTVNIIFNKVTAADGYCIKYTTGKGTAYKVLKYSSANAVTYKGLKSGQTYYFRVCAYKKCGNSRIYGDLSDTVKIKIK